MDPTIRAVTDGTSAIDVSGELPKPWSDEIVRAADAWITMGCGDAAVRPVRDERRVRVEQLLVSPGIDAGVSSH